MASSLALPSAPAEPFRHRHGALVGATLAHRLNWHAVHPSLSALFDLSGRVAIVTGGSRGLGRAVALGFAEAGASVVLASRKLDACQEVADEIEAAGGAALAAEVRMQEPDGVHALVDQTVEHFGRLDIVVNNAATVLDRTLDRVEPSTFEGAFATNLLGPLLLVQAAVPHLAAGGHGSVINVLSIAAFAGSPGRYLYPPVKAALGQTTRTLARDLGPLGIRVNAISPGTFLTDMVAKAYDEPTRERMARTTPLGRIGDPRELVGPMLLLASDAGSFITGTVLTVDAGATA
jgi:NAD(P)-dependent dehydrogenase (short-subunit alcohol dehydrogenase family)